MKYSYFYALIKLRFDIWDERDRTFGHGFKVQCLNQLGYIPQSKNNKFCKKIRKGTEGFEPPTP